MACMIIIESCGKTYGTAQKVTNAIAGKMKEKEPYKGRTINDRMPGIPLQLHLIWTILVKRFLMHLVV